VVFGSVHRKLSYWRTCYASRKIDGWTDDHANHHQARGRFPSIMYGISHCLIDRDGRMIGCDLPIENGPLLEQVPAMAQILRELAAGVPAEHLRRRAAQVLERIDAGRAREPGEDNEQPRIA
jgi:hypothetical protein